MHRDLGFLVAGSRVSLICACRATVHCPEKYSSHQGGTKSPARRCCPSVGGLYDAAVRQGRSAGAPRTRTEPPPQETRHRVVNAAGGGWRICGRPTFRAEKSVFQEPHGRLPTPGRNQSCAWFYHDARRNGHPARRDRLVGRGRNSRPWHPVSTLTHAARADRPQNLRKCNSKSSLFCACWRCSPTTMCSGLGPLCSRLSIFPISAPRFAGSQVLSRELPGLARGASVGKPHPEQYQRPRWHQDPKLSQVG